MTRPLHKIPALLVAAAGLTLVACSTQEIGAQTAFVIDGSDPRRGAMLIWLAPSADTIEQQRARDAAIYDLFIDGNHVYTADNPPEPVALADGGFVNIGFIEGEHDLKLVGVLGGPTLFEGHYEIAAGSLTYLYLFGPSDAIEDRLIATPINLPVGTGHASAINLIRAGMPIEVVKCDDADHCAAVSPPLGLGESYGGDFPLLEEQANPQASLTAAGAGVGYRLVPNAAVPTPPILSLARTYLAARPVHFAVGPVYMTADGRTLAYGSP